MIGKRIVAIAVAVGLGALGAGGVLAGETGHGKAEADKADTSKRVCRNLTPSGSRLTKRVCRTQEEWAAAMDKTQDGVLQHQRSNSTQLEAAPGPR
jgi:hypothetical protein